MKKLSLVLVAFVALMGFVACTSPTSNTPTTVYSQWWLKGSFDSWQDGGGTLTTPTTSSQRHYLTVDQVNSNKLSFVMSSLRSTHYEFVLVSPDGKEYKYTSATEVTPGTAFTMGDSTTTGSTFTINVGFTAAFTTYTVDVNIATATAPSVNLVAGSTASTPYSFAELAAGLTEKGDQFSNGWGTNLTGTADATAKTVTFTAKMTDASVTPSLTGVRLGTFGFNSLDGFIKCGAIVSPTAASASSTPLELTTTSSTNASLTGIPNQDSAYSIIVTIDPTKAVNAGRYMMTVTLTTVGSAPWPPAPATVYLVGSLDGAAGMTLWSELDSGRAAVTLSSNIATFQYTASATAQEQLKWATAANAGWNGLVGDGVVDYDNTGTHIALSGSGGNIVFNVTSGTIYTIHIDYSGTSNFASTGKPTVWVTTP